jgi:hypothetical protein
MTCYIDQMRLLALAAVLMMVLVIGLVSFLGTVERGRVSRARLQMFARRHQLTVTVDNGNGVIRYLATTRRWRTTGLVVGLIASVGWALSEGAVRVDFLTLFAGWFVGALIAEIRLARTSFGPLRAASLTARVPVMYLPRLAWWLVPAFAVVSVGIAVVAQVRDSGVDPTVWLLAGAAVGVAAVVNRVQARVLRRPQPVAAADVVAADDAIRSRSLHVLTGGGATLVLYCVLGQLFAAAELAGGAAAGVKGVVVLGYLVVPLLGWAMATTRWRVVRPGAEAGSR